MHVNMHYVVFFLSFFALYIIIYSHIRIGFDSDFQFLFIHEVNALPDQRCALPAYRNC